MRTRTFCMLPLLFALGCIPTHATVMSVTTPTSKPADEVTALKVQAEQGSAGAQKDLGVGYAEGRGGQQDYRPAVHWFRKAATQRYAEAQYNLGLAHDRGHRVPQDDVPDARRYGKAAEQGHTRAQHNLGLLYANRHGIPQDYVRAYMWLSLAMPSLSDDDKKQAAAALTTLTQRMTPQQVEQAQAMAAACVASQYNQFE